MNGGSGQWKRLRSRMGHALDDDDDDDDARMLTEFGCFALWTGVISAALELVWAPVLCQNALHPYRSVSS